jgi:two-component system cell cycle response regulator
MYMNHLIIFIVLLSLALIIVSIMRQYYVTRIKDMERSNIEFDRKYQGEILSRDDQIRKYERKTEILNSVVARYGSFMLKIPSIVQRLNTTADFKEVTTTITQLVSDIVPTKKVDLYYLDTTDNLLKKVSSSKHGNNKEVAYALGEGLIGKAARERMVWRKEQLETIYAQTKNDHQTDEDLWMAVPICFRERVLGVIGIGHVAFPVGNESDSMRMIANLAGVALINQAMLGEAKDKANTDSLTGLNNRHYLQHMAQTFVEKALRENTPISIFLFDIDNFKHYNDTNGHDAGDKLLVELSDLARSVTRKNSVIIRYGGEEFLVVLPAISKEEASVYAERFREKVSSHPFPHRENQPLGCLSISGGIASFPADGETIFKVIQHADRALYQAKSDGKNRILQYTQECFSDVDTEQDVLHVPHLTLT